jgi:hypothetical protein
MSEEYSVSPEEKKFRLLGSDVIERSELSESNLFSKVVNVLSKKDATSMIHCDA